MHRSENPFTSPGTLFGTIFLAVSALFVPAWTQLIISELHRDPLGTESSLGGGLSHEFVEITNLGPQAVDLDALFISNGLEADSIVSISDTLEGHEWCVYNSVAIAPGATAVILDPDYRRAIVENASCRFPVSAGAVILQCGDAEFGSTGLASDHGVIIYRGTKNRIDTILCGAVDPDVDVRNPAGGKFTLATPVNREGVSIAAVKTLSDHPTFDYVMISPGWYEPLRQGWLMEYDFSAVNPTSDTIDCNVRVLSASAPFSGWLQWRLVTDDGSGRERTLKTGNIECEASRGRSVIGLPTDVAGFKFSLLVNNNPSWDIDLSSVRLPSPSIRITELFPKATSAEPEWFEIANVSAVPINIRNWRFGNNEDAAVLTPIDFIIDAGMYVAVTKDGAALSRRYLGLKNTIVPAVWHTLNNSKDTLMLFDAAGVLRESVCWDEAWFETWTYLSLERNAKDSGCSPSAWSVAERSTPAMPNSALYWRSAESPSLDIGPVPFTPDNDGRDDRLAIRLIIPAASSATVDIYGFNGRIVRRFSGLPQEIYYWDGRDDSGSPAPVGPFFVVAQVKRGEAVSRIRKKGILWRK